MQFELDTLDVTVEPGPVVRIETKTGNGNIGAIIPFSSGSGETLVSSTYPARWDTVTIGNGNNTKIEGIFASTDPIILGIEQQAFSMPTDGFITKTAAVFSLSSATGAAGVTSYIRAKLFSSPELPTAQDPIEPTNAFMPVAGTQIDLGPITDFSPAGEIYHAELTLDNPIAFKAGTRFMFAFIHTLEPTAAATISGVMSGGLSIANA